MRNRLGALILCLATLISAGLTAAPAQASGIYKTDGNDTPGPLDLASVRLTSIKGGDRFQIRTLSAFTTAQLNGVAGWIEVDFDISADRKIDEWVVVYYDSGKLFAVEGEGANATRTLPVRRVDARTVSFDIQHRQLGPFYSYDFAALSVWRSTPCSKTNPCVDAIPNKYPLLRHDFTAPTAKWTSAPIFSADVSDTASFPVSFIVKDDQNGSGVKHWTLQYRTVAGAGWTTADSGSSASATVLVPGQEGATVDYRLRMVDRQGNARVSDPRSTVVPFDDRNSVFIYTSGSPTTNDGVSGAFLGTTSTIASGTTFTATMPGMSDKKLCIVGGPTASSASLQLWIGGNQRFTFWEGASTPDHDVICTTGAGFSGAGTITLVGGSSDFVFDGFAIKP